MTEEIKYTPGPWAPFSDETEGHTNIMAFKERTRLVFSLPGRHKSEPDVRLIATTPDLYEALKDMVPLAYEALSYMGETEAEKHIDKVDSAAAVLTKLEILTKD